MSNIPNKKAEAKQLDTLIKTAVKKIGANKENDICRYIPSPSGGYIHHFTMRKMKGENPTQLLKWVNKYIINMDAPQKVAPKKRAARGSRKRRDQVLFSRQEIERVLNMARMAGDVEVIRKLIPKKDPKSLKKELLSSIRRNEVDQELWNSYVEMVNSHNEAMATV